jgi:CubicO group peptidase (beta-lactamase class C family)
MKHLFSLLLALSLLGTAQAQTLYFPPLTGSTWDTTSPASLGMCQLQIDSLYFYLDTRNTKAYLLLKDGKIVLEKYFDGFTKDSAWYWASAGKTLTAFTIGLAQAEGKLSIYDSTSKYLKGGWTSCSPTAEAAIRIRNQLTMTTGLNDAVSNNKCTLPSCLQFLATPGSRWAYHNGPYTLLQNVLDSATGDFKSFFNTRLRNKIGMTGSWFVLNTYDHVYFSTPRSAARFGLLMLGNGTWNGTPIMTDTTYFREMITTSQTINPSYGYLWWLNGKAMFMAPGLQPTFLGPLLPNAPSDAYSALGSNGQIISISPSKGLVMVRMGQAPAPDEVSIGFTDTIWRKTMATFCTATAVKAPAKNVNILRAYPQPASEVLNLVKPDEVGEWQVELWDVTGRLMGGGRNILQLDISALPRGIYQTRLISDKGTWSCSVVIGPR